MSAEVESVGLREDGDEEDVGEGSPMSERSPSKITKSLSIDLKICGVCGDKALGNNFNAITCESCKAFFRRNALRSKVFVCPFNNNCKVDAVTRRFCQKCRLKKCFDIGMKKEWIMTDEEKRMKKQKIEQNRLKRSGMENSSGGNNSGGEDQDVASPPAAKVHIIEVERDNQRPVPAPAVESILPDYEDSDQLTIDEGLSPKIQKQPMGPHNQNNSSAPYSKKGKERNIISGASSRNQSPTPYTGVYDQGSQPDLHQTHFQHENHQSQNSWNDGDDSSSSSSTLSQPPPPLCKYPPNKRQLVRDKFYAIQDETDMKTQDNEPYNQMPLLSSLISTGYPESSPDPISSPPVPNTIEGEDESSVVNGSGEHKTSPVYPVSVIQQHQQRVTQPRQNHIVYHEDIQTHHHHETSPSYDYQQLTQQIPTTSRNGMEEDELKPYDMLSMTYAAAAGQNQYDIRKADGHAGVAPIRLNTIDSILSIAIAAEFNSFGVLGSNLHSRELNKAEQNKLNELLLAIPALHAPIDAERPIKVSETSDPSLLNVINLTEIAIRRLIKMSKKISGFKNMCQEDQVALLKGGCTEMMILRSVVTYDPDRDSWQLPTNNPGQYNINLGVLKEARGNLYEEHQRFVKSFRTEWRKDENIMIILCAITLFTPERLNVIHKDVVKLEQDSYYYLLKRYLESIYNGCEAKSSYLQLIRLNAQLRALNSSHVRVFLEMNPKEVEPLLIEIFDLK